MSRYFLPIIFVFFNFAGQAQMDSATLSKNIYAAEDSMISIFKRQDWKRYADYMHPVLLEMTGGKEKFVQMIEQQMQVLKDADIQVHKTGKIMQQLKMKEQYQAVV